MSNPTLKIDHVYPQKFYPHKSSLSKSVKCTLTILYPQKVKKCPKKCILAPSENELAALKMFTFHPQNSHFILSKLITSHPQNCNFWPSKFSLRTLKMFHFNPQKINFLPSKCLRFTLINLKSNSQSIHF